MLSVQQMLLSPEWFPDAIYADRGVLDCYKVSRRLLAESPFLDQRMTVLSGGREQASFTYEHLMPLADSVRTSDMGLIFHTSFCRSTLMAQALHLDGVSFALKEPSILLSLAESIRYTRVMRDPEKIRVALAAMLKLITGLVAENEKVIIKPTNFANNLLPYVAAAGMKILFMYSDMRSYLISILKYGERGRLFARQLFARLMSDCVEFGGMDPKQSLLHTDLQIAALVWQQQVSLFMEVIGGASHGQIRTLSSDAFGSDKKLALTQAYDFFSIPVSDGQIDAVLEGAVFQRHSKSGKSVESDSIQRQTQEIALKYHDELESVIQWSQSTPFAARVNLPLENSLV